MGLGEGGRGGWAWGRGGGPGGGGEGRVEAKKLRQKNEPGSNRLSSCSPIAKCKSEYQVKAQDDRNGR